MIYTKLINALLFILALMVLAIIIKIIDILSYGYDARSVKRVFIKDNYIICYDFQNTIIKSLSGRLSLKYLKKIYKCSNKNTTFSHWDNEKYISRDINFFKQYDTIIEYNNIIKNYVNANKTQNTNQNISD